MPSSCFYILNPCLSTSGHLIYELGSGRELTVPRPSDNDLGLVQNTQVNEVLKFIFWNENGDIPTIAEVYKYNYIIIDLWSFMFIMTSETCS